MCCFQLSWLFGTLQCTVFCSVFSGFSWPWHFWRVQASQFVEHLSVWFYLSLPHNWVQGLHLRQDYQRSGIGSSSCIWSGVNRVSICPITGDTHLGHLIKVICAMILHSEVIFFPFVTSKYFMGKCSETVPQQTCNYFMDLRFYILINGLPSVTGTLIIYFDA